MADATCDLDTVCLFSFAMYLRIEIRFVSLKTMENSGGCFGSSDTMGRG